MTLGCDLHAQSQQLTAVQPTHLKLFILSLENLYIRCTDIWGSPAISRTLHQDGQYLVLNSAVPLNDAFTASLLA